MPKPIVSSMIKQAGRPAPALFGTIRKRFGLLLEQALKFIGIPKAAATFDEKRPRSQGVKVTPTNNPLER